MPHRHFWMGSTAQVIDKTLTGDASELCLKGAGASGKVTSSASAGRRKWDAGNRTQEVGRRKQDAGNGTQGTERRKRDAENGGKGPVRTK